ncbi:alcohol dehydrogenase catalytic domain-containing protein [Tunturiibacter gelidiferens]|uniref:alcohol dehydrogenase catalytic domain-containing protein n=1 Tax=Tunturiibacter gelidiferens TaxID=3069689 RepID=UPI003D9ADECE
MKAEMTAAVLYGKEDLRLERVAIPQAGAGELVVRVGAALTCGTDLKVYRRGYHAKMLNPPILFGHELAGVVEQVGAGVGAFKVGDRVVALNSAPCDVCFFAGMGSRICVKIFCSITGLTRSLFGFRRGSSKKIR